VNLRLHLYWLLASSGRRVVVLAGERLRGLDVNRNRELSGFKFATRLNRL